MCSRRSARRCCSISSRGGAPSTLLGGGVSERPKEHASKACEGASPPWVQIPPPPPTGTPGSMRPGVSCLAVARGCREAERVPRGTSGSGDDGSHRHRVSPAETPVTSLMRGAGVSGVRLSCSSHLGSWLARAAPRVGVRGRPRSFGMCRVRSLRVPPRTRRDHARALVNSDSQTSKACEGASPPWDAGRRSRSHEDRVSGARTCATLAPLTVERHATSTATG